MLLASGAKSRREYLKKETARDMAAISERSMEADEELKVDDDNADRATKLEHGKSVPNAFLLDISEDDKQVQEITLEPSSRVITMNYQAQKVDYSIP